MTDTADTATDVDDLRRVWRALERRLARDDAGAADAERRRRVSLVQALRPLRWGQALQIPFGLVVVLLAIASWRWPWDLVSVRIAALVMHAYGIALIAAGARTLVLLGRIDYGAPVLAIQRQLADVRRWYGRSGLVLGMAWWLLWLPVLVMLAGAFRIDLVARGPRVLLGYAAACVVGLVGSLWAVHWAEHADSPVVRRWAERAASGESLFRAAEALDEIQRFEDEDG